MKKYRYQGKVYRVGDHVTPDMLKEHLNPAPKPEPGVYTDGEQLFMVGEDGKPHAINGKDDVTWLS